MIVSVILSDLAFGHSFGHHQNPLVQKPTKGTAPALDNETLFTLYHGFGFNHEIFPEQLLKFPLNHPERRKMYLQFTAEKSHRPSS